MMLRRRRERDGQQRVRSGGVGPRAGLGRGLLGARPGALPVPAGAHARARPPAALPGHPRQVQVQQVSAFLFHFYIIY
jgi:hypothetical protein